MEAPTFDFVVDPMPPVDQPLTPPIEPSPKKKKYIRLPPPPEKKPTPPPKVDVSPLPLPNVDVRPVLDQLSAPSQDDTVVAVLAGATVGAILALTTVYIFSNILIK